MDTGANQSLEKALAKTESDAEAVLKAVAAVGSAVRRLRAAAQVGNLRDVQPTMTAAEQAIATLRQQFANAKEGWDFDEEAYLEGGAFAQELKIAAQRLGVGIYEQDDRLYCYPSLIRVLPNDRAVLIDKARERRLRPTVLANHLRDLQRRPPRFRPEPFLEALFEAYETVIAKTRRGRDLFGQGIVAKLLEIYNLLTLLPGQSREYSRQEFARDIYLLDQSGITRTRGGYTVSFPVGTGARAPSSTLKIVTREGGEKIYYGIAFIAAS